ncbi:MAG: hypothetical protein Q4C70_05350 [Planctomycetia bacterium]|nr:hypothetical protein [Planctomycetia bacterium]
MFQKVLFCLVSPLIILWILLGFCVPSACFGEESKGNDTFLETLEEYAQNMVHFPLHPFTAEVKEWRMLPEPSFYEFMEFARSATEADLEACVSRLDGATAKERCLIFAVLFYSLDTKYLPIIAEYRNDTEPAFSCIGDPAFNYEFAVQSKQRRSAHEKISRCEFHYFLPRPILNSKAPDNWIREHAPFEVGGFARSILECWDCFPSALSPSVREVWKTYKTQKNDKIDDSWPEFSAEDWTQFNARDSRLQYYINRYITRVLFVPPEKIDTETVAFLKEVETLPLPLRVEILLETELYVADRYDMPVSNKLIFYTSRNYPFPCATYEDNDRWQLERRSRAKGMKTKIWQYPAIYALWQSDDPQFYERQWEDFLKDVPAQELLEASKMQMQKESSVMRPVRNIAVEQIQKYQKKTARATP